MKYSKTKDSKLSFVPANAGYFQLEPVYGGGDEIVEFCKNPVIAWAIEQIETFGGCNGQNLIVTPVSTQGSAGDDPILHPDGRIELLSDTTFHGENAFEEALAYMNERAIYRKSIRNN